MSLAFRYRASTSAGEIVEGIVRAASSRDAIDELRRQTLVPVEVEPAGAARAMAGLIVRKTGRRDAVAVAMRTLATLLAGGASLDRSLAFAAQHAGETNVASALAGVQADVRAGRTLASALADRQEIFGALAPAVVLSGEEGGGLDAALERLADHLDRMRELRAQLRAALWYPALMGIVAGVGVIILLIFVVPRFVGMLSEVGGTLPASTRLLMALSGVVMKWWWAIALLVVIGFAAARTWLRDPANRRRWHAARLTLPIFGELERGVMTARFARALGALLASGAGVLGSLRTARESVSNAALATRLDDAVRAVERGERVAPSLEGALPALATQLLAVGEESGSLDRMAIRVADTYDAEVQRTLRTLVGMVEPALIIAFGAVVGFVALAMLQAVYSINASVL
jgi:general secretion pathway protein F